MIKKIIATAMATAMSVTGAFAAELSSMSWDEVVAQAKSEGELTWFVWYFQDDFRAAIKPFEEMYDIKVTIPEGNYGGNLDKLIAETGRDVGDIDVMSHGWNALFEMNMEGTYVNLTGLIPNAEGKTSNMNGLDSKGYALAYWGNQSGVAYDPAKIDDADLPQTVDEFVVYWTANPNAMGFNYENGGSGPSFYQNVLRNLSDIDFADGTVDDAKIAGLSDGVDFFKGHAQNYVITAGNTDSLTRLSDGELTLVPAWEDHLAGLQKKGEVRKDLKFYIPTMGMNGGGNSAAIPQNAPHSAAALLFIDWLTSAETQTAFNVQFGAAPTHADSDDSHALVSSEQRKNRVGEAAQPFRGKMEEYFIENVILAR
ncbi:MAG: extracellular solute-binding protein [Alphaproteobacteria bacterium]|nr:extracellular solute-binding protein [Alphaproteobacteria bacterium]